MANALLSTHVFVNCPFDDAYKPIFDAIVFAIYYLGFVARCASETDDSGERSTILSISRTVVHEPGIETALDGCEFERTMLRKLPQLVALARSLGRVAPKPIAEALGIREPDQSALIGLSLSHVSYLHETRTGGLYPSALRILESLGSDLAILAVDHVAYLRFRPNSPGDADEFLKKALPEIHRSIVNHLGIGFAAAFGRSLADAPGQPSEPVLHSILDQLIAALYICRDYAAVLELVENHVKDPTELGPEPVSYKDVLLHYSRRALPGYEVVCETGPQHAKLFKIRAYTTDGLWAEGEGPSKKAAEQSAARAYLEKHAPRYLRKEAFKVASRPTYERQRVVARAHRQQILALARTLQLSEAGLPLLSEAFTHSSYAFENKAERLSDNSVLAHVGSSVLDALVTEMLTEKVFQQSPSAAKDLPHGKIASEILRTGAVAEAFQLLHLGTALLVGRGQRSANVAMKAQAFQATLGAKFIALNRLCDAKEFLGSPLFEWLDGVASNALVDFGTHQDKKGQLQELAQAARISLTYDTHGAGPAHVRRYHAALLIGSPGRKGTFRLEGGTGPSKKQAEQEIARIVLNLIDTINSKPGWPPEYLADTSLRRFALFLLSQELAIARRSTVESDRLRRAGALCCNSLITGDISAYRRWARQVDRLFELEGQTVPDADNFTPFYGYLRAHSTDAVRSAYESALESVRSLVQALDPEDPNSNVTRSPAFASLVALAEISRILSKPRVFVPLHQIMSGLELTRRTRPPRLTIAVRDGESHAHERDGTVHAVLNQVLSAIEMRGGSIASHSEIQLRVLVDAQTLHLAFEAPDIDWRGVNDELQMRILWQFLSAEIPIVSVLTGSSGLDVQCAAYQFTETGAFMCKALEAFYGSSQFFSIAEHEAIAQLLHDLKNLLVAYQILLDSPAHDLTARLRAKYEASSLKDNALTLVRSLEAIRGVVLTPLFDEIRLTAFFREYIARRMTSVPSNIRIDPPRTADACVVRTAPEYLRSILDNLLRNSIEAMPAGGEIRLDWLHDQAERTLVIEVSDDGCGMEAVTVDRIVQRRGVPSSKRAGSGLGILTVQTMLDQLGGSLSVNSRPAGGTRWTIVLPSLDDSGGVVPLDHVEDSSIEAVRYTSDR